MVGPVDLSTAVIGKCGLGGPGSTGVPTRQGFDLFFGSLDQKQAHNHYPTQLWRTERPYPLGNTYFSAHQKLDDAADDPTSYRKYAGVKPPTSPARIPMSSAASRP